MTRSDGKHINVLLVLMVDAIYHQFLFSCVAQMPCYINPFYSASKIISTKMASFSNLPQERNSLLAQQSAVFNQLNEETHVNIEYCHNIHHQSLELEEEENAHDEQENLQPPMHTMPGFNYDNANASSQDHYSMENVCLTDSSLAIADEEAEEIDCFSYYCGDDGVDADSDFCNSSDSDSEDDNESNADGCLNCHLQERFYRSRILCCMSIAHQEYYEHFCAEYDD